MSPKSWKTLGISDLLVSDLTMMLGLIGHTCNSLGVIAFVMPLPTKSLAVTWT